MYSTAQLVPSRAQRWAAGIVCFVLIALTALTLPVAGRALPPLPAFFPIYLTLAATSDLFTGFLLLIQFRAGGSRALAVLAIAYLSMATLIIAETCAFPGLLSEHGLFGARAQTTVWLWVTWHTAFPLMIIVYAVARRKRTMESEPGALATAAVLATGFALGLATAYVAYALPLPALVTGSSYTNGFHGTWQVVLTLIPAALIATIVLTRLEGVLDLWLVVALVGTLCDAVLTIFGGARFSAGWYFARVNAVVTALTVSTLFIVEFSTLYGRFARLASIDPLTGLANRRAFDDRIDVAVGAANRDGTPLCMLMLDVDDFKKYNDTYGHRAGDDALRQVAEAARNVSNRPRDLVARYGGEEFSVILPDTDLDGALVLAERILNELIRRKIPHRKNRAASFLTISIGAARALPNETEPRTLIERADQALYRAKNSGRNRVVS